MAIWTLAKKEIRLLLRDRLAAIILLGMPLLFILILGLLLGEPDKNLRISLVDLDEGKVDLDRTKYPALAGKSWAEVVRRDLEETGGIQVEILRSEQEARHLIDFHNRAAVLVFKPDFSKEVNRCSFLADGINPFFRDGVYLDRVEVELLRDNKQPGTSAIIEQVVQVTLLRVLMPYMIGKAFEKLSEKEFIQLLGDKVRLPVPDNFAVKALFASKGIKLVDGKASLNDALKVAAPNEKALAENLDKVGAGVQDALRHQFRKYDLTGMTWAALTKAQDQTGNKAQEESGGGLLNRGGAALPDAGAGLHGHVRLLPGDERRLDLRVRAPAGDAQTAAGQPAHARPNPAGQAGSVLPAVAGPGHHLAGGRPVDLRHALGAGHLVAGPAVPCPVAGGLLYLAGGNGAGPAGGRRRSQ